MRSPEYREEKKKEIEILTATKEEQENKMEQIFHNSKEPTKRKLRKRINTLEGENEVLKNTIKDELYNIFMKKLAEPEESKRYKEDNIRLRKQIKELKQIIKEERSREEVKE